MVPIPFYNGDNTYTPILDYTTIVLNSEPQTYSILTEQEEYDCLFNRCYISDVERPVSEKSCGIPQFFDLHLDICTSEQSLTHGVFLKPMLPDGIIFALESEVTARLFCNENTEGSQPYKLNGTGIMRLPNGCTLTITDSKNQKITRVKGQPLYRMVQVDVLNLSANGPLGTMYMSDSHHGTQKLSAQGSQLTDHLLSVVKHVDNVNDQVSRQATYVWGLVGIVTVILVIIMITIIILYKCSGKFRRKIHELRERFAEITQKFSDIEDDIVNRRRGLPPSPSITKKFSDLEDDIIRKRRGLLPSPIIAPKFTVEALIAKARARNMPDNSSTYLSLNEMRQQRGDMDEIFTPTPSSFKPVITEETDRHYPRLTPLFLKAREEDEFGDESKEVDSLCQLKPFLTNNK
jgi:hypothetical protein